VPCLGARAGALAAARRDVHGKHQSGRRSDRLDGEGEPLAAPAPGQSVTVEIELPASHGFGPKCIHCEGTVMRVSDSRGEYPRVALRVNYMDFRSFHDEIRAFEALHPAVGSWMA
jgi:hypothetical protein